jgi:hypothetical protein
MSGYLDECKDDPKVPLGLFDKTQESSLPSMGRQLRARLEDLLLSAVIRDSAAGTQKEALSATIR